MNTGASEILRASLLAILEEGCREAHESGCKGLPLDLDGYEAKVNGAFFSATEVDDLAYELSLRVANLLKANGVRLYGDLVACTAEMLLGFPSFGGKALAEVREMLAQYGRALEGEVAAEWCYSYPEITPPDLRSFGAVVPDGRGGFVPLADFAEKIRRLRSTSEQLGWLVVGRHFYQLTE